MVDSAHTMISQAKDFIQKHIHHALPTSLSSTFSTPQNTTKTTVLLSETYTSPGTQEFQHDWESRPWITYRKEFPMIQNTDNDVGWGCMIRSAQMLLANALLRVELGRDYRINTSTPSQTTTYTSLLTQFNDTPESPYSIHAFVEAGETLHKHVGEWFGPNTIASAMERVVNTHQGSKVRVVRCDDSVVYKSEILSLLSPPESVASVLGTEGASDQNDTTPLLILIPVRLGVEEMNPLYHSALKACFTIPFCVGVAGGKPNSAYFFVGYVDSGGDVSAKETRVSDSRDSVVEQKQTQEININPTKHKTHLLYLDPHTPQLHTSPLNTQTYIPPPPQLLPMHHLDPSLLLGFVVSSVQEFTEFCASCDRFGISSGKTPLFGVGDTRPRWYDVESVVSEDEF